MDNKSFMLELSSKLRDVTNVKQSPSVQKPPTSDCRSSDVNVYEKLCYNNNNNSDYSEITDVSLDTPRFVSKASKWRSAKTGAFCGCFTRWAVSWNVVCVCVRNKK